MTTKHVRSWTTPEAEELAASAAVPDPVEAMRRHARALLEEHGDASMPVRLSTFFDWAGVRKVRSEETALEGALRRLPDGRFDIIVREDRAPTRKRFSIAHELGHVLFYRHAPTSKARQFASGAKAPDEEERLCNVAAEEILMPCTVVQKALVATEGAERVISLARHCEVSVEASLVRVAPFWAARGEVQLWEYRGTWKLALARRLGRTRTSLATFAVDQWGEQHTPATSTGPWRGETTLYSRTKRQQLGARTMVLPINRRVPTLLISHEVLRDAERSQPTALARAAQARVHRAQRARPRPDCPRCNGCGWVYPSEYDPATRLNPVPLCDCRFDAVSA